MANKYWVGKDGVDPTNPSLTTNWDDASDGAGGDAVPTSADDVIVDGAGTSNNALTLTAPMNFNSLSIASGYTAKFDLASYTLTITDTGNVTLAGGAGGEFDWGDGEIIVTNSTFNSSTHAGTWTPDSGTLTVNGSSTVTANTTSKFATLVFAAGSDVTIGGSAYATTALTIAGDVDVPSGKVLSTFNAGVCSLADGVTVSGDGAFAITTPWAGGGITSMHAGAAITVALIQYNLTWGSGISVLAPGTYNPTKFQVTHDRDAAATFRLSAGTYVFGGAVEYKKTVANTLTIDHATNDPDVEIKGDVIWTQTAGTITYTKSDGDGTLTFSGTADQDIDFGGSAIENVTIGKASAGDVTIDSADFELQTSTLAGALTFANSTITGSGTLTATGSASKSWDLDGQTIAALVVNKSGGTLTFSGGWTATSYTQTAGAVDFNGQTLETSANWRMTGGTAAGLASSAITVGGIFRATGLDLIGGSAWTLDVAGSAIMRALIVTYCNAGGGDRVSAYGCTDGGSNVNFAFFAASETSMQFVGRLPEPMIPYPY